LLLLFLCVITTGLAATAITVHAVETEPTPPADSVRVSSNDSAKYLDSAGIANLASDSSRVDSLKSDSAAIKLPLCSEGVRATIAPTFKKFGRVSYDRKIVTLTEPVTSLVRCCIDVDGTVLGSEIAQSCTIPLLDEIAVRSASRHTVLPGKVIDEIVQTAAFFKVTFKLGKESRKLYGRYEIGELEYAFIGLDTTLPKLGSDASVDSMIPESLLIAAQNAAPGSKAMTSLDSARMVAMGRVETDDTRVGSRSPKDSTGKPVASNSGGKKNTKEKSGKAKPPKKEEELIPDVDAVIAVDQLALITRAEKASYPREEAKNRVEGTVWIASLIDSKGRAREHKIWKSSGNAKFDQAAMQAAVTFKYQAAQRDGKPIMTWLKHRIEFRLSDS
jgi:TonB family protein